MVAGTCAPPRGAKAWAPFRPAFRDRTAWTIGSPSDAANLQVRVQKAPPAGAGQLVRLNTRSQRTSDRRRHRSAPLDGRQAARGLKDFMRTGRTAAYKNCKRPT